jgi:hypothetical protein
MPGGLAGTDRRLSKGIREEREEREESREKVTRGSGDQGSGDWGIGRRGLRGKNTKYNWLTTNNLYVTMLA